MGRLAVLMGNSGTPGLWEQSQASCMPGYCQSVTLITQYHLFLLLCARCSSFLFFNFFFTNVSRFLLRRCCESVKALGFMRQCVGVFASV